MSTYRQTWRRAGVNIGAVRRPGRAVSDGVQRQLEAEGGEHIVERCGSGGVIIGRLVGIVGRQPLGILDRGHLAPHYAKMRTALKAGQGIPDVAQVEFQYIATFSLTNDLLDITSTPAQRRPCFRTGCGIRSSVTARYTGFRNGGGALHPTVDDDRAELRGFRRGAIATLLRQWDHARRQQRISSFRRD